ncbi:MAG: lysine--tRNA ligase [archaeon]
MKKSKNKWAYKLESYAEKAIERAKKNGILVTCRCGETPGGTKHIGNFNDNIRSYFLYLIIKGGKYPVRHIQTRDNLDPFRKLPGGFADLNKKWHISSEKLIKKYTQYVGKPLFFIPDPLGCCENYAEHFRKIYEKECKEMGLVDTQYFSTEELYRKGKFNPYLKKIFEKIKIARKIDLDIESTKSKDYVPVWVICEKCGKITGKITKINFKEETVDYVCTDRNLTSKYKAIGCGKTGKVDWKNGKTKMDWEFEWPAQMLMFNTIIEPFGKEHHIGSWPFSKKVIEQVYEEEVPIGFFYEYFLIKGQKMATRHGNVLTVSNILKIIEPEVLRFLYTKRWTRQRNINLLNINQLVRDFDFAEKVYFGLERAKNEKEEMKIKKNYELAMLFNVPKKRLTRISYEKAARIVKKIPKKDWKRKAKKRFGYYNKSLKKRLELVENWLREYKQKDIEKKEK